MFFTYNFAGAVQIDTTKICPTGLEGITLDNDGGMMSSPSEPRTQNWWFRLNGPNGFHFVGVGLEDNGRAYSYISDNQGRPLVGRPLCSLRQGIKPSADPNEKLSVLVYFPSQDNFVALGDGEVRTIDVLDDVEGRFELMVKPNKSYALRLVHPTAPKYGVNWQFVLEADEDDEDDFSSISAISSNGSGDDSVGNEEGLETFEGSGLEGDREPEHPGQ